MRIEPTPLAGLFLVEQERTGDDRGYFARTYDIEAIGPVVQMSTSFNPRAGTLRGLHFQADPHAETKLVRCTRGSAFDVAVDLRAEAPTRYPWFAVELSADNGRALLIPKGFAHGFQTLEDDTEVLYAMDVPYDVAAARGVRWDDPAFGIDWPEPPGDGARLMSARDAGYDLIAP
ncbi:MAG: dTDP-4-dehydrorhamnose 3,5-epimerase [Solirubrobacteraceae bacterium]|jgi:dTDP-4-dehydrorhamnose 3,5-epimerase|nr:dTDP-4-dehydrorhamnose 3,5-epimerase [Solirubrobacteraceae bacterium]